MTIRPQPGMRDAMASVDGRVVLAELPDDEEGRHRSPDLRGCRLVVACGRPGRQPEADQPFLVARRVPPDELADVWVVLRPCVVRRSRRDQDQGRDALRIVERQGQRGPAAAAVPDDDRRTRADVVQHGAQVGEPGERDGWRRGAADTPVVVPDQPEPVREQAHHRRPDPSRAPTRIDQYYGCSAAASVFRPYLPVRDRDHQLHLPNLSPAKGRERYDN
jgi:hypothetical protein